MMIRWSWRLNCAALPVALALAFAFGVAFSEDAPQPGAESIKLNFKDTQLDTVLDQLSEMTGLVIVREVPVEGRITITSKQAMNVNDAIALINAVLLEKSYVAIRNGKVLKVVKLEDAKRRNIPVHTGYDPATIPTTEEVITQVIPIHFIDAAQLKKDFATFVPAYADLSANAGSNTLILTDTCANIHRIAEIIQSMDKQSTALAEVKVFQLKYANAASAARLINDTFKEEEKPAQNNILPAFARFRQGGGQNGGAAAQPQNADSGEHQSERLRKVTASADDRTNAVVVSASPDVMVTISQIIKELDSNPAEEQGVFIYRCMNAQAANLETVVNTLFASSDRSSSTIKRTPNQQQAVSTGIGQNVARAPSSSSLPGSSSLLQQTTPSLTPFNQQSSSSTSAAATSRPASLAGDLTGQVFVVADTDTNSLIVLAASKNFDRVKSILKDLDRPVPQVLIKVLIAEVTHDKTSDVGTEFSVLTHGNVTSTVTDFGLASATGGLITKAIDKDVSVTLRALETEGKVDILSRPYILASDNQLSSITVGNEVPFIVNSLTTDTGEQINTIQYQDIGIILNVTAHINDDGLVIMDVAPQVSALTGQTVPIAANASAPVFSKRSAQSRVGIQDGQTVVIGGMMEDKKTDNEQGVPFFRRIPALGNLFRRRQSDKSKTELLIFLTPHVAHIPDMLKCMTEQEKAGLKIVPKAVAPGVFDEHLRGLDRGNLYLPAEEVPLPEVPQPESTKPKQDEVKPGESKPAPESGK